MTLEQLRRACADKRDRYQHAKAVYTEALRLVPLNDLTALRGELEHALVAYYACHSELHSKSRPQPTADGRLH